MRFVLIALWVFGLLLPWSSAFRPPTDPKYDEFKLIKELEKDINLKQQPVKSCPDACKGAKGENGFSGPRGFTGPPGNDGKEGAAGPQGLEGFSGRDGLKGDRGRDGRSGLPGMKGDPGVSGLDGFTGLPGEDGIEGPEGPKGEIGRQGKRGYRGYKGEVGESGLPGLEGPPGLTGETGPPGSMAQRLAEMFSWKHMNDTRDAGIIAETYFKTHRYYEHFDHGSENYIHVFWQGSLAVRGSNLTTCRRWYFTIHGKECVRPGPIGREVVENGDDGEQHLYTFIDGMCKIEEEMYVQGGYLDIGFHVGPCESEQGSALAFTGMKGRSSLLVEEIQYTNVNVLTVE